MDTRPMSIRTLRSLALACAVVGLAAGQAAAQPAGEIALARSPDDPGLTWSPCPPLFPAGCEITVLHGDPAQRHADIFFKVPGGYEIPRHWHTSAEHMVLVSGELAVTYDGQAPVVLTPGMYAYGPPRAPHVATCAEGAPCILFIAFEEPVDAHGE